MSEKTTAKIETITPDRAEQLLSNNPNNRHISAARVSEIATAIRSGEWTVNGDAIRLASSGRLLDGQHRLSAIVAAGMSVDSLVVYGLNDEVFATIDQGAKRSPGDVLSTMHVSHANTVAAVLRCIYLWITYGVPYATNAMKRPRATQIVQMHEEYPEIAEFIKKASRMKFCRSHFGVTMTAFCWYVFAQYEPEIVDAFFDELNEGAGMEKGSPVLLLRERVINLALTRNKIAPHYKCGLVFKAFKFYRSGKDVGVLKIVPNEKNVFSLDHDL